MYNIVMEKKKLLFIILSAIALLGVTIVLIVVFPLNNQQPPTDPTDNNGITQPTVPVVTADNFILPEKIIITIDESNVEIPYQLPNNISVVPEFTIYSGNSIEIIQDKVSPVSYGITKVKAKAQDVIKYLDIVVFQLTLTAPSDLMCGEKADKSYTKYQIDLSTNYEIDLQSTYSYNNLQNVNIIQQNQAKTNLKFEFEILDTQASFTIQCYDKEYTINLTANRYISNFQVSLSNDLEFSQNKYILYKIVDESYRNEALSDGYASFSKIEILNTNQYELSVINSNLKLNNNLISTVNAGESEIIIKATDGSNYEERIKFSIIDTYLLSVETNLSSIELSITKNKQTNFNLTLLPFYASVKNYRVEYNNEVIDFTDGIITALQVGQTQINIYLNDSIYKSIDVKVLDEYRLYLYNNLTSEEITNNSLNIDFSSSNQISLNYIIKNHNYNNSIIQKLNISIIEGGKIIEQYDFVDKIYLKVTEKGQIVLNIKNEDLLINENLYINIV